MLQEAQSHKKVTGPLLTPEEMLSLIEDSAVKGTGFNMNIASSEKGRVMIEQQMDSRRQRHIVALKESQKFIDQFYDTFCEKKNEIKEQCQQYTS